MVDYDATYYKTICAAGYVASAVLVGYSGVDGGAVVAADTKATGDGFASASSVVDEVDTSS